jgi:monoamine oxidase
MLRRKFVLSAIKASPFFLFQSSLTSACSLLETEETPVLTDKKIIIIGAGISGLAAAKKLKAAGFTVVVLESQEKIGGRLDALDIKSLGNGEIDALRFANLQEKVEKSGLIFEAKQQALTNELHSRLEQLDARTDDLEAYLMKTTEFVRRKNTK